MHSQRAESNTNRTINEFIRLGDVKNATDEDVIASAKASGAHEIIMKLKVSLRPDLARIYWS